MIRHNTQSKLSDWTEEQVLLSYFFTEDVNQLEIDLLKKHCKT